MAEGPLGLDILLTLEPRSRHNPKVRLGGMLVGAAEAMVAMVATTQLLPQDMRAPLVSLLSPRSPERLDQSPNSEDAASKTTDDGTAAPPTAQTRYGAGWAKQTSCIGRSL